MFRSIGLFIVTLSVCSCASDSGELDEALAADERLGESSKLLSDTQEVLGHVDAPGVVAQFQSSETQRARAGYADLDQKQIDYDSQFRIASVTKTFTAVVVLQLAEEGKLSLDDTVEQWLPGVVQGNGNDGSAITIKQLLRHESGLNNYVDAPELGELVGSAKAFESHRNDTLTQANFVELALQAPAQFEPGTQFSYSNTNYVLLGMIIEAITDEPWGDQVEERIILPLGLARTFVPGDSPSLQEPFLPGFVRFPGAQSFTDVTETTLVNGADSGVVSSLSDLNLFFRALMRRELLQDESLEAMKDTIAIDVPRFPNGRYGLGLQWSPLSCGDGYYHHTGETIGYSVATGVIPDGTRSVVVVANGALDGEQGERSIATLIDHALCD